MQYLEQKRARMGEGLCFAEDQYVSERIKWIVELSNGNHVFQDDERPGAYPHSAWLRLKNYLSKTGLWIVKFHLEFRSHRKNSVVSDNSPAYFFCKQLIGSFGDNSNTSCYLVGYLDKYRQVDPVKVYQYRVPEIELTGEEYRSLIEPGMKDCLIWKR